jgi:subtilisin family serine protease
MDQERHTVPGREPVGSIRSVLSRLLVLGCVITLLLEAALMVLVTPTARAAPAAQELVAGDTIFVLRDGVDPVKAARQLGVEPTYVYRNVFPGFAGKAPASSVTAASQSSLIDIVSPSIPVKSTAQVNPTGVRRIQAAAARPRRARAIRNVGVAVLDTGIQQRQAPAQRKRRVNFRSHDLNVRGGTTCIGNGTPFVDRAGHGTHVAGTIGARNNSYGVIGVAPGVSLYAVKVLDDQGFGTTASLICGLDWVARRSRQIDVVNLSLAGRGRNSTCAGEAFHRAICRVVGRGISVVVAAGNDGQNASQFVPARFPEVITVGAFADTNGLPGGGGPRCVGQTDDTFAPFSNFGPDVDIMAPGVCIRSTRPRGGTIVYTGTSMAAPHVTGALALYYAAHPRSGPAGARQWLLTVASTPQSGPGGLIATDPRGPGTRVLWLQNAR